MNVYQIKFNPNFGDMPHQPDAVVKKNLADTMEVDASMKNYKDGQNGVDNRGNQSQYGLDEISDKKEKMKKPEALDGNLNRERKIQEDLEQKINLDLNSAFLHKKLEDDEAKSDEMKIIKSDSYSLIIFFLKSFIFVLYHSITTL